MKMGIEQMVHICGFYLCMLGSLVRTDCPRPTNLNPNVTIAPDQATYGTWHTFSPSCPDGYSKHGPDTCYCTPGTPDYWDPDPSFITCSVSSCVADGFGSDVRVANSSSGEYPQTEFDLHATAYFSCAVPGEFYGSPSAECTGDGTFDYYGTEPSCTAHCAEPFRVGLNYTTEDTPVFENDAWYYRDGATVMFYCEDGYPSLNCTVEECERTCDDGTWIPDPIPRCLEATTVSMSTAPDTTVLETTPVQTTMSNATSYPTEDLVTFTSDVITTPAEELTSTASAVTLTSRVGEKSTSLTTTLFATTISSTTSQTIPSEGTLTSVSQEPSTTSFVTTILPTTSQTIPSDGTLTSVSEEPSITSFDNTTSKSQQPTTGVITHKTTRLQTEIPPTLPPSCEGECEPLTELCNPDSNTCDCRPGLYRDGETEECQNGTFIQAALSVTHINGSEASYSEELDDPDSQEFKEMEDSVCSPFDELYAEDPNYILCAVIEFSPGSINVDYVLTFTQGSTNYSLVEADIQEELNKPNGSFSGEYQFNTSIGEAKPLDFCHNNMHDCDKNANCNQKGDGFTCECNDGYEDMMPELPGRICAFPTTELPTTALPTMDKWKVIVGVTVPVISILVISVLVMIYQQIQRQQKVVSQIHPSSNYVTHERTYDESPDQSIKNSSESLGGNAMDIEVENYVFGESFSNGQTSFDPVTNGIYSPTPMKVANQYQDVLFY